MKNEKRKDGNEYILLWVSKIDKVIGILCRIKSHVFSRTFEMKDANKMYGELKLIRN